MQLTHTKKIATCKEGWNIYLPTMTKSSFSRNAEMFTKYVSEKHYENSKGPVGLALPGS